MANKVQELFESVTDRIIASLERGVAPWSKPWRGGGGMPVNGYTMRPYRGLLNTFLLSLAGQSFGSNYWCGYGQAIQAGGCVRKGEKATFVLSPLLRKEQGSDGSENTVCRGFRTAAVFNLRQCDGVAEPQVESPRGHTPEAAAEKIIAEMPSRPTIIHGNGIQACYRMLDDSVRIAAPECFTSGGSYYSTLFHELAHSTGAEKRLGRPGVMQFDRFGSHQYSQEELVAEMSAAYLMAVAGIENEQEQSAAYIGSWLKKLKDERGLLLAAAGEANRASRYIAAAYLTEESAPS